MGEIWIFFIDQTSRAIKKDITSEFKGQGLVLFCFPKGINFTKATISHYGRLRLFSALCSVKKTEIFFHKINNSVNKKSIVFLKICLKIFRKNFLVSKKTKVLLSLLKSLFFCSFLKSNNFLFLWMIQGVRPLLFFSKSHHCSQKFSVVLKNFHCLQKLRWTYQPFLNWSFWLNWQLHLEEK